MCRNAEKLAGLALALALSGCATGPAEGPEPIQRMAASARTRADHEALATWHEREARAAGEKADRHRRILDDTYRPAYGSPYVGIWRDPGFLRRSEELMRRHQQIAEENLPLAKLHRQRAVEAKE